MCPRGGRFHHHLHIVLGRGASGKRMARPCKARGTPSERSDASTSILQGVFVFVKKNLSGVQRRKNAASGESGTQDEAGVNCQTSTGDPLLLRRFSSVARFR